VLPNNFEKDQKEKRKMRKRIPNIFSSKKVRKTKA
jgi:hypothetical protein